MVNYHIVRRYTDGVKEKLQTLMQKPHLSWDEKAEKALELGKEYLGVENGHIAKVVPINNYWKSIVSTDEDDGE